MRRAHGFTLIELLVTLAVIIIMATVAVPSFRHTMHDQRVVADYNELLAGLHLARSEAIKRREDVEFTTLKPEEEGEMAPEAGPVGPWRYRVMVGDQVVRERTGRDATTAVTDISVTFNALGKRAECEPSNCTLELSSSVVDRPEELQVSPAGRVGKPEPEEAEGGGE